MALRLVIVSALLTAAGLYIGTWALVDNVAAH
jgi:hypothetical protein